MQSKLLLEADGKTHLRGYPAEGRRSDALPCRNSPVKEGLGASQVTAIGAFSNARLAFFDWEQWPRTANQACMYMQCSDRGTAPPWPGTCMRVTSGPPLASMP